MARFLDEFPYRQAILSDSGDIIFQGSLKPLLDKNPDKFRAVTEDLKSGFSVFITDEFFNKSDKKSIRESLVGKDMINAGFFAGPADKMKDLGERVFQMILQKDKFGPDQLVVNYLLHNQGFVSLDRTYNYVIATSSSKLKIQEGLFYADDRLITVVHNTGNLKFLRPIENFGYRNKNMSLKKELMFLLKRLHGTSDTFYDLRDHLTLRLRELRKDMKDYYHRSTEDVDDLFNQFVEQISQIQSNDDPE